jgi:hypothetical protein
MGGIAALKRHQTAQNARIGLQLIRAGPLGRGFI